MYFHFLEQFLLFLSLFKGESETTDFLNSTLEGENVSAIWSFEEVKDLHIFPSKLESETEAVPLPVCCTVDEKTETFQCNKNKISIPEQNSKQNNSALKRFTFSSPKCPNGYKFIVFDSKSVQSYTRFLRNGYFGNKNEFYSPHEYCINRLTGEDFVEVKICEPECSEERPCIQKCCEMDEIYSFKQRKCIKSKSVRYKPTFYHDMSKKVGEKQEQKSLSPHFTIRFPRSFKHQCQGNRTQIFPAGNLFADYLSNITGSKYYPADFRIRKDGTILYRKDGKAIVSNGHAVFLKEKNRKCYRLKTEHYCIDGGTEYGDSADFANDEGQIFLATCPELLYQPPVIGPLSFVYGNVMICSSFFSLMTALVYLILEEKRNIHGLSIVSYASSMFFMYVFLGLAHLIRFYDSDKVLKSNACVFIGIASHLFSLSSFVWLTIMNWNLWYTFKKIRPTIKKSEVKLFTRYLKYALFGWGLPLSIICISSYLHFNYEEAAEEDCKEIGLPLPAYGRESCEIKQLSLGAYLYFPASAFLLCNLVFFVVTAYALCKHEKTTAVAIKRMEERHHQSIQLFGKLWFVMGVTRGFEVITWYEGGPTLNELAWYWAVFDIFNILQAVAIFIIYVCKKDVLFAIKRKMLNWTWFLQGLL